MKISVDISLYPLADDYLPAIQSFIERVSSHPEISVERTDLSTQLFGDYDLIMDTIKTELRINWQTYGKGIFVIKFLMDDLRGLKYE